MKLILFREGEALKHPITGKVLHTKTEIVAEARIDAVYDEVSRSCWRLTVATTPMYVFRFAPRSHLAMMNRHALSRVFVVVVDWWRWHGN